MVAPQPCFEPRGSPMNVRLMCRTLVELGFEVHLATFPFGQTDPIPGLTYHRVSRIPFVRGVPIGFSLAKAVLDVLLAVRVARLLWSRRYLAVHGVEEAAFFVAPLGRLFRTPAIADMDSNVPEQLEGHRSIIARLLAAPARAVERWALRSSACALTVCESLTTHVKRYCPDKAVFQIEDVPPPSMDRPPDAEKVAALRRDLGVGERRVLLYAGNLEPYQGVDLLVEALPMVRARFPDTVLVVIGGEEAQMARIEEQGRSLGVSESVRLLGKIDPDRLPEFMALAEVLVSPRNEGENTPFKIYGYMLSGKPIVATDIRTHTQVLDESTAILTPVSADGLAEGAVRALSDPAEAARIGALAREVVRREYNSDMFRERLHEVYRFIARQHDPS
jgi:glycosyltransferase involved in cell wall biosynthesis